MIPLSATGLPREIRVTRRSPSATATKDRGTWWHSVARPPPRAPWRAMLRAVARFSSVAGVVRAHFERDGVLIVNAPIGAPPIAPPGG
jgi:hypothetical protein